MSSSGSRGGTVDYLVGRVGVGADPAVAMSGIYGQLMVEPPAGDYAGIVVKSPGAGWYDSAPGFTYAAGGNFLTGLGPGAGNSQDATAGALLRLSTLGVGALGAHFAQGLRGDPTGQTQSVWIEQFADTVGLVIDSPPVVNVAAWTKSYALIYDVRAGETVFEVRNSKDVWCGHDVYARVNAASQVAVGSIGGDPGVSLGNPIRAHMRAPDGVDFYTAGVKRVSIANPAADTDATVVVYNAATVATAAVTGDGRIVAASGTVARPAMILGGGAAPDLTAGVYRPAAGQWGIIGGSAERARADASGFGLIVGGVSYPIAGRVKLGTVVLGGAQATIDFASIPAGFEHLELVGELRTDVAAANDNPDLRFNNDSTNGNYYRQRLSIAAAATTAQEQLGTAAARQIVNGATGATAPANEFTHLRILVQDYAGSTLKQAYCELRYRVGNTTGLLAIGLVAIFWDSTAAVNRLTLAPTLGANFAAGSKVSLYGILAGG